MTVDGKVERTGLIEQMVLTAGWKKFVYGKEARELANFVRRSWELQSNTIVSLSV